MRGVWGLTPCPSPCLGTLQNVSFVGKTLQILGVSQYTNVSMRACNLDAETVTQVAILCQTRVSGLRFLAGTDKERLRVVASFRVQSGTICIMR